MSADQSTRLQQQVKQAIAGKTPQRIQGGNSKYFYGHAVKGETLDVTPHHGMMNYQASELVMTARAGTPLHQVQAALAENNQMLPFEPPAFGESATLGGTLACGLSGPRRPFSGAARDYMLGCRILTGKGDIVHFGGEVMKNVAGYDVSRLMVGALGTLGVLLEVSLKVLPCPARERTRLIRCDAQQAIQQMNHWAGKPLPLSAACYYQGQLYLRFSGADSAVEAALDQMAGETLPEDTDFWLQLREQRLDFFHTTRPLWRLSLAAATPPLQLAGETLLDWGGAQRWLLSDRPADEIRSVVETHGGHATLFRSADPQQVKSAIFHPPGARLRQLHLQLKQAFDPFGILNFGRLYPDL